MLGKTLVPADAVFDRRRRRSRFAFTNGEHDHVFESDVMQSRLGFVWETRNDEVLQKVSDQEVCNGAAHVIRRRLCGQASCSMDDLSVAVGIGDTAPQRAFVRVLDGVGSGMARQVLLLGGLFGWCDAVQEVMRGFETVADLEAEVLQREGTSDQLQYLRERHEEVGPLLIALFRAWRNQ